MDSDMHVVEPPDLRQRYLDAVWRDAAPVHTQTGPRDIGLLFRGAPVERSGHGDEDPPDAKLAHAADDFLAVPLSDETKRSLPWTSRARLYGVAE